MNDSESPAIERRIERFLAGAGAAMALGAGAGWGVRAAEGAAVGAALCWLNFRLLRHEATVLMRLALTQAGADAVSVPRRTRVKLFGRLALLLAAVYATLAWLRLPGVAVLCGLAAVVPAIVIELGHELMHGVHHEGAQ